MSHATQLDEQNALLYMAPLKVCSFLIQLNLDYLYDLMITANFCFHSFTVQVSALETVVIKHVACGDDHTLAVSDRGQVLGWGRNDRGQCGLATGDAGNKPKPR